MTTGIILLGGNGTRLLPLTKKINKHMLPLFNKPMWHYPFSFLISVGITSFIFVVNKHEFSLYKELIEPYNSSRVNIVIAEQSEALGIVNALQVAANTGENEDYLVCLGDNLFIGYQYRILVQQALSNSNSSIFTTLVDDPEKFGVAVRGAEGQVIDFIEKSVEQVSNEAVVGLYKISAKAIESSRDIKASSRGEFEIIDLLRLELKKNNLTTYNIPEDSKWFDLGSAEDLIAAALEIQKEEQHGAIVGSPEVELYKAKLIDKKKLEVIINTYRGSLRERIESELNI